MELVLTFHYIAFGDFLFLVRAFLPQKSGIVIFTIPLIFYNTFTISWEIWESGDQWIRDLGVWRSDDLGVVAERRLVGGLEDSLSRLSEI